MCLAVTCHLHFWQNDRNLVRATAIIRGWNGYRNKSQHRNLTMESRISPPFLPGTRTRDFSIMNPALHHWAIPALRVHTLCGGRMGRQTDKREHGRMGVWVVEWLLDWWIIAGGKWMYGDMNELTHGQVDVYVDGWVGSGWWLCRWSARG